MEKKILFILFCMVKLTIFLFVDFIYADSSYMRENTTITVSSYTVTRIPREYGYRQVYLGDPDTIVDVHYRVDDTTTNITTDGWWIPAGQGQAVKSNSDIYLQLKAGDAEETIRKMTYRR